MLGALTSLTGGGGLSASGGDATSGNGDMFGGGFNGGALNYNSGNTPVWVWIAVAAAVLFVVWQMKK